jgi:hypothetical protein
LVAAVEVDRGVAERGESGDVGGVGVVPVGDEVVEGGLVNDDAALSEQFFHVTVGSSVAQVPEHHQHGDLARETEPSETRPRCWHPNRTDDASPQPAQTS